jgi:hypothetical protein
MENLKLLLLFLIISLLGKDLYSQKIFRNGYIVLKTGESQNGLVKYSANQKIPTKCTFKSFDIAHEVKYTPDDILAFGYKNGNRFESKKLNNKNSFYEVLVSGKVILYKKGSKFYLEKENLGFVELKDGPINYLTDSGIAEFKNLTEFLIYLTEGKAGIIADKFELKTQIIPIITTFNKNSGKSYSVLNRTMNEKQLIEITLNSGAKKNKFGFVSGINIYLLNLHQDPQNSNFLPDPKQVSAPIYGLTYERSLSSKTDRFSLKIEMLFNKQAFYSYEEHVNNTILINRNDAFINFTGIKIPTSLQYSITGKKLVPFFNVGFAYQYFINKNYLQINEVENTVLKEVKTYEYRTYNLHNGEISGMAGLGLRIRIYNNINLHFQGRVEFGPGVLYKPSDHLPYQEKAFKHNSFQRTFLIGITF